MKPLMMAALVVQLTSAGGAGSGQTEERLQAEASPKQHFSALKTEVTSLKQQFKEARERARLESERRQQESEALYEPQTRSAAGAAAAPGISPAR
jgi:hypothetical protein